MEYYAFISYKRKDEKWAKWLQNKLETYKLPSSLSIEDGREYPKALCPCFRDKTDLSETGDLTKILHDKLQKSQYLIVICSPRSAKSKWVNKEVEIFQTMGRADKIIPFIIEGTPDTSNLDSHCYPCTLNENILGISIPELGKERAAVKTIATMLQINFNTLWDRHRERILKRKIKIAIFSTLLIALLGGTFTYLFLELAKQKNKTEEFLGSYYFYDEKFALCNKDYKDDKLSYFIDKKGKEVDKLKRWCKAEPFNEYNGFAKVTDWNGIEYLLDTLGKQYKYSNDTNKIDNSIEALDLSKQNLLKLPEKVWTLTNLKVLDISHNNLKSLPPEIGKLTNLNRLNLCFNKITILPPEIGELKELTELNLAHNEFTDGLPPEVGKLTNLTKLWLCTNKFTSLPPEIGELKELTELSLYKNKITSLPPEIGKLTKLTKLDLSCNRFTYLPPEIGKLTDLTELMLLDNKFPKLPPPEIGKLKKLTKLGLYENKLTSSPSEIVKLNDTLTELKFTDPEVTLKGKMDNTHCDGYIWGFVRKEGTTDWWIQENYQKINGNGGTWEIVISIGERGRHEGTYEVRVIAVSEDKHQELLNQMKRKLKELDSLNGCRIVTLTLAKELSR